MKSEHFKKCREEIHLTRGELLASKGKDYRNGAKDDVLENFKTLAEEQGISPEQVLYIYLNKHVRAISKYCRNPEKPASEPIKLRIADLMNYADLLFAMTEERPQGLNQDAMPDPAA